MKSEAWAQSRQRTGIVMSRGGLGGGFFIFYLLYGAEYFVGHGNAPGISVCLYGFLSPFGERNGKVVHIEGNPIISSTNNGLSCGESCPSEGGKLLAITPGS